MESAEKSSRRNQENESCGHAWQTEKTKYLSRKNIRTSACTEYVFGQNVWGGDKRRR
jgi:hypothetical protein